MRDRGSVAVAAVLALALAFCVALTGERILNNVNDTGNSALRVNVVAGSAGGGGAPSGAAGGDLAGTYPDPTIGANAVALGTDTTGGYAGSSTEGGAATTCEALAVDPANCLVAGEFPKGVDAAGVAQNCTAAGGLSSADIDTSDELNTIVTDSTGSGALCFATSPTIVTPTIASFANAGHDHEDADDGGTLDEDALAFTDVTTNNATTTKHGLLPKLSNVAGEFLNGVGAFATPAAGTPSFPVTVAGTVNSGGIPYFSSTTVESSSAALTSGAVVVGGGAGTAPFSGNCTNATGTLPMSCPAASGSEVFGLSASAGASPGANNTIVGNGATITTASTGNVVIGQGASTGSSNNDSVAIGRAAFGGSAGAGVNVAIGASSSITVGAGRSVAIGQLAVVGGNDGVSIGRNASCGTNGSIILGSSAACTEVNQFVAGSATPINNVYFGKGVASSSATAYTINGTGGSGTNNAGAAVVIASGKSTGTAIPPDVPIQTSIPTTTGTTAQTLGDRERILGKQTTLTDATAISIARVNLPTSTVAGGEITFTAWAQDATDFQSRTLRATWSAVNKAGTLTMGLDTPSEAVAVSAGSLTCALTVVDATGGNMDFQANCDSSLTTTVLKANAIVTRNFAGAISAQ